MTLILPLLLLIIIVFLYVYKKLEWFIALICVYLALPIDMVTPFINIGSHYLLLITLFVIAYLEYKKKNIQIGKLTLMFAIAWAGVFFVYLVAYLISGNHSTFFAPALKFIGILAFAGEVILLILLSQLLDKEKQINAFKKFVLLFVSINSIFVLLQIYVGDIGIPITKSIVHSASFDVLTQNGFVTRAMGITPSPVMLAAILLMLISIMLAYTIKNNVPIYYYLFICFTGFIAMLSNTKTFILGLPLVIIVSIVLVLISNKSIKQKMKQAGIFLVCLIIIFGAWFFLIPSKIEYVRNGYIAYLGPNIVNVLDTRQEAMLEEQEFEIDEGIFDGNEGQYNNEGQYIYKSSKQVIEENWLIGVGPESVYGEYFTDMSYIAIMHNGGLTALVILFSFYLVMFIKAIKQRSFIVISTLIITAAIFLTFSWYINVTYVPFIAFSILLLQEGNKLVIMNKDKVRDASLHNKTITRESE